MKYVKTGLAIVWLTVFFLPVSFIVLLVELTNASAIHITGQPLWEAGEVNADYQKKIRS